MTAINNKIVGERIKKIRTSSFQKKLTQTQFANLFSPPVNRSAVKNWESGLNLPNNERLKQISDIGNVTIDYLLFGKEKFGIGHRIKKQRKSVPLSREELAAFLSNLTPDKNIISTKTIDDWENEVTFPALEELKILSSVLHCHYLYFLTGERKKHETDAYHISPYRFLDNVEEELDKHNFTDEKRIQLDRESKIYLNLRLLSIHNPEMYYYVTHLLKQIEFISYGNFDKNEEYTKIIKTIDYIFQSLDEN